MRLTAQITLFGKGLAEPGKPRLARRSADIACQAVRSANYSV
jgi:hypothetical protein